MEQTKIEMSKPILSPTRSLDEGFESDPDRISTDSELTSATQTPTFDLLHRTDRDGVHHTTITRHNVSESSPISSIICLDGGNGNGGGGVNVGDSLESDCNNNNTNNNTDDTKIEQPAKSDQQKQHIYRRVKNKAPLPPKSVSNNSNNSNAVYHQTIQPRSQSVDRIRVNNDFNKSTANQNILAGRFVRVTVDPKQQYLNYFKNYKSYQHYQTNTNGRLPSATLALATTTTTGSTSNLSYKSYHSSSNIIEHQQQPIVSGLLSLSNLSSSMMQQTPQFSTTGYSTIKLPKSYQQQQHFSSHHHHHQSPQSHFLASSWTQSMDPRKARK